MKNPAQLINIKAIIEQSINILIQKLTLNSV